MSTRSVHVSLNALRTLLRRRHTLLWISIFWAVVTVYGAEWAIGFVLVKSIALSPVPPGAVQRHETRDYAVTYRYNNIGLRGPDFDPHAIYDALLVGDSFMFGTGVEDDQSVAGVLTARGLRVFSAAEPATNPPQYLQKVRVLAAWGLNANAMVVGLFIGNDFQGLVGKNVTPLLAANAYVGASRAYSWRSFLALQRVRYVLTSARIKLLGTALFPHDFERRMKFDTDWIEFFAQGDPKVAEPMRNITPWDVDEEEFLRLAQINDETMAKVLAMMDAIADASPASDRIVVLLPVSLVYTHHYDGPYARYMDELKSRLSRRYRVLDMHEFGNAGLYLPHDGHLNPAGNRCLATAIEAALKHRAPPKCPVPPGRPRP